VATIKTVRRLREAREATGLTRARLASLAGCSIASLANIEQGAVPKRSAVLERAWAVIESINDNDAPPQDAAVQESGKPSGHVEV
jgi:transcriptional regulator with XRE-family HTH domain